MPFSDVINVAHDRCHVRRLVTQSIHFSLWHWFVRVQIRRCHLKRKTIAVRNPSPAPNERESPKTRGGRGPRLRDTNGAEHPRHVRRVIHN